MILFVFQHPSWLLTSIGRCRVVMQTKNPRPLLLSRTTPSHCLQDGPEQALTFNWNVQFRAPSLHSRALCEMMHTFVEFLACGSNCGARGALGVFWIEWSIGKWVELFTVRDIIGRLIGGRIDASHLCIFVNKPIPKPAWQAQPWGQHRQGNTTHHRTTETLQGGLHVVPSTVLLRAELGNIFPRGKVEWQSFRPTSPLRHTNYFCCVHSAHAWLVSVAMCLCILFAQTWMLCCHACNIC